MLTLRPLKVYSASRQALVTRLAHPPHLIAKMHHPSTKKTDASSWSLLIFLVGEARQSQALEKLKEVTYSIAKVVARQCEVQASQKIRRGMQLYSVYCRMWGEEAARAMLTNLRRMFMSRSRHFLLSAICLTGFDWEKQKISDDSLLRAVDDLDSVTELCRATVECDNCHKRQIIDQQMSDVDYCTCTGSLGYTNTSRVYDSWEPFIEREHHIVWRQRHHVHNHLFAYKVYGHYDDVSLSAFMEVQLNTDFRNVWDDTALQLRVLESHETSNSALVYWRVKFPFFFANRDYIFKRRFALNEEKEEVVIMCKAIDPNYVAEEKGVHRVNEYWSRMVIRARDGLSKPGIEYTLTYFDNPGTSLPQKVTNFIAATGFPNFLRKVHKAAISLQGMHEKGEDVYVSLPNELRYPGFRPKQPTEPSVEPAAPSSTIMEDFEDIIPAAADSKLVVLEESRTTSNESEASQEENSVSVSENWEDAQAKNTVLSADPLAPVSSDDHKGNILLESESLSLVGEELKVTENEEIETPSVTENEEIETPSSEEIISDENTDFVLLHGSIQEERATKSHGDEEALSQMDNEKEHKDSPSSLTTDMHVCVGNGRVTVGLLEAMEVVAPDMEGKTVVIEKLGRLKTKLKSFREQAAQKKTESIKKMREVEFRMHYDHSNTDEKTLMQLEVLFQAMREILDADRNMRTGKGYRKHELSPDPPKEEELLKEINESKRKMDKSPEERESEDQSKERAPVKDEFIKPEPPDKPPPPPPPPAPSLSQEISGAHEEGQEGEETQNTEVEKYNCRSLITESDHTGKDSSLWPSWIYIPYITQWIYEIKETSDEVKNLKGIEIQEKNPGDDNDCNLALPSVSDNTYFAQIRYVLGFEWIFHSRNEEKFEKRSEQGKNQDKGECNNISSRDTNAERGTSWYWYPVNGVYRVFSWAFRENV